MSPRKYCQQQRCRVCKIPVKLFKNLQDDAVFVGSSGKKNPQKAEKDQSVFQHQKMKYYYRNYQTIAISSSHARKIQFNIL